MSAKERPVRAVLWDFGGVILSSPFDGFRAYEDQIGLPAGFIRGLNAVNPHSNAWARMERGEIGVAEFCTLFEAEAAAAGHRLDAREVLSRISGHVRPDMVSVLRQVGRRYRTACLTDNMQAGFGPAMAASPELAAQVAEVMRLFDHVIESSRVGVRKPEPRFYEIACEVVGIEPGEAVYLDDLGINLKPARAIGMRTIKVVAPEQAIADLETVLGHPLR